MLCEYCGSKNPVDFLEAWGFDFMLEFCCEEFEQWSRFLMEHWSAEEWTEFLLSLGTSPSISLRRAVVGDGHVRLHYGLTLVENPSQKLCRDFITEHHRHNKKPPGWRWGHAIYNGGTLIGVGWVGNPVSRVLMERGYVEINRCCVSVETPHDLVRNACSMIYGAAARRAGKEGFSGLVTYIRADETGVSVRAAGFEILPMPSDKKPGIVKGRHWGNPLRPRERHEIIDKIRWGRRF